MVPLFQAKNGIWSSEIWSSKMKYESLIELGKKYTIQLLEWKFGVGPTPLGPTYFLYIIHKAS